MSKVTKAVEVEVFGVKATDFDFQGGNKDAIKKELIKGKFDLDPSQADKVWAKFGAKANKSGVFDNFINFLKEGPKTEQDMAVFLRSDKSSLNELRWFNQRNSIRELSIAIFKQFDVEFTEVRANIDERAADLARIMDHDKANKAKKAATK